jgi:uncharacterized integral membrane protein (TIGR00698 family)
MPTILPTRLKPGAALSGLWRAAPGLVLSALVAGAAVLAQWLEARWLGRAWMEALVLAIILGVALRAVWTPGPFWKIGVDFAAKTLLEIAVALMGVAIGARAVAAAGPALIASVVGLVAITIAASYGLGRAAGLPHRMAVLIACGTSICGNSAIATVAPVIDAEPDEVAAAIGFTAVLGVGVVLSLPLLAAAMNLSPASFGIYAGLTVYAVPQVMAAAAPAGVLAVQSGTLVKLMRVLTLGPVCLALALLQPKAHTRGAARRPQLAHLLPWFIVAFMALAAGRATDMIPQRLAAPSAAVSSALTIAAMAALGLGVDLKAIGAAGPRTSAVVTLSLATLGLLAFGLLRLLKYA